MSGAHSVGACAERSRAGVLRWWFPPLPRGRVAALRTFVYGFIIADLFVLRPWVVDHGRVPQELYRPLVVGELLNLPAPTESLVRAVMFGLLAASTVALTGRLPRLAGALVFVLYAQWMVIAFSYGKVDHDRFAFLVALAVLPTVGRARWGESTRDDLAGWAIRCIQVAVVLTYFLSVYAKLRFGGIEWVNSATLARAVLRRGTFLADPLIEYPEVLRAAQYAIVGFELASPALLAPGRIGRILLGAAIGFHALTFIAVGIAFWPHIVCLLAFLPLERLDLARRPLRGQEPAHSVPATTSDGAARAKSRSSSSTSPV